MCCAFQHSALCFSAQCVVLFSTVRCAFQHSALCFSAQCVVLFSTLCCAFQHTVLCFSAHCVVLFSTVRCAFQHNVLSLSAQCQVQALFKAPRLGSAACPSLWWFGFSLLKNQDRNYPCSVVAQAVHRHDWQSVSSNIRKLVVLGATAVSGVHPWVANIQRSTATVWECVT